jgi:hypothetical protein
VAHALDRAVVGAGRRVARVRALVAARRSLSTPPRRCCGQITKGGWIERRVLCSVGCRKACSAQRIATRRGFGVNHLFS